MQFMFIVYIYLRADSVVDLVVKEALCCLSFVVEPVFGRVKRLRTISLRAVVAAVDADDVVGTYVGRERLRNIEFTVGTYGAVVVGSSDTDSGTDAAT